MAPSRWPLATVHLVLDNDATHKAPPIQRGLVKHPRFALYCTPARASWLNLVERWFAELTTKKLPRSARRSVADLEAAFGRGSRRGMKTADQILAALATYCKRITDSGQ